MGFKVSSTIIVCMVALCLQAGAGHATAAMNGTWVNETLDSGWGAWFSSLAFDNAGNPGISYYSWTQGSLEYANKSGGIWHIDDVEYFAGLYNSLAFDPSGNPAISYMSWVYTPNDLGYAWKSGGT